MTQHDHRQYPCPIGSPSNSAPDFSDAIAHHMSALGYAVRDTGTFADPYDAYRVLGDLVQAAERLPHALDGIAAFLRGMHARGMLRVDNGADPHTHARDTSASLRVASAAAHALAGALNEAFQHVAAIGYDPNGAKAPVYPDPSCPRCKGDGFEWYTARDGEFCRARCSVCRDGRVGP